MSELTRASATCRYCDCAFPPSGRANQRRYCSIPCRRRATHSGRRADGTPFVDLHDTEKCGHPDGCERQAAARDLCLMHYTRGRLTGDLPPLFKRTRPDEHELTNVDLAALLADCSICGPGVPCYSSGSRRGRWLLCSYASGSSARKGLYGLDQVQYDLMLIRQGNRCALCRKGPEGRTRGGALVVDHCHATGSVRVLLCDRCNHALGLFEEDPDTLRRALALVE